jgi:hypothetical protein
MQENKFEINFRDKPVNIEVISLGGQTLYKVTFPDKPPLFITRAKNANAVSFWTSVPEGRQQLAEEIGKRIEEYIKT